MSFLPDLDEQLIELTARNAHMDQLCTELGRDPSSLRRSANLYDAKARAAGGRIRYYDDLDLFTRLVTNLADAGYQEIGLYHPTDESQMGAFEPIAQEIIPRLRDAL